MLARKPTEPFDFHKRVVAVDEFSRTKSAPSLVAANKRVSNILSKVQGNIPNQIDSGLLKEPQEVTLAEKIITLNNDLKQFFDNKDYIEILSQLSLLKDPVDNFFDNVIVMADDEKLKMNRLAILSNLRELFLHVADISLLQL